MEELKTKNAKQYVEKILEGASQALRAHTYLSPVLASYDVIVRTIKILCGDDVSKIYDVVFLTDENGDFESIQVSVDHEGLDTSTAYVIPFKAFVKVQKNKNPEKIAARFSAHKREL